MDEVVTETVNEAILSRILWVYSQDDLGRRKLVWRGETGVVSLNRVLK